MLVLDEALYYLGLANYILISNFSFINSEHDSFKYLSNSRS